MLYEYLTGAITPRQALSKCSLRDSIIRNNDKINEIILLHLSRLFPSSMPLCPDDLPFPFFNPPSLYVGNENAGADVNGRI